MRIASLKTYLPLRELLHRTYTETMADDGLGLAAQLAYYFFLALVPALLFLLALASFFPLATMADLLPAALDRFAAPEMITILRNQLQQISNGNHGGLLSLGLLGAIWSSSAALVAIINALNRAYDIEEQRPWWKVRLVAIGLTIGLAVFVLLAFTLVVAGPTIANVVAAKVGLSSAFLWTWKILQWPVAFLLVCFGLGLVYYFAPDAEQDWVWVTPGALLATTAWLVVSLLFRVYVVSFGNYQATYGALGGVVVLLLWMYITALVIVVGAELNAEIEHASPWAKAQPQTASGERRKIGAAAARAFRERRSVPASRALVPVPALTSRPAASTLVAPRGSFVDYVTAFLLRLVWPRVRRPRSE